MMGLTNPSSHHEKSQSMKNHHMTSIESIVPISHNASPGLVAVEAWGHRDLPHQAPAAAGAARQGKAYGGRDGRETERSS